jgi:methionyl-tRNA formyltransferase
MKHPYLDLEKQVGVVGCKHTTRDLILGLARYGFAVDHCVTISPDTAINAQVAGYYDLRAFLAERDIPCTVVERYNLKAETDRVRLLELGLDCILVMGWQRLIPEYWLNSLSIGAFGMHGSSKPLPHGRGRSPMNWSIIQGKTIFYTHLFKYLPGTDDGPIVGVQTFDITPFDDGHTLHFKNLVAMKQLCARHLPELLAGAARLTPQPDGKATYYPKRSAEDGLVFWDDSTAVIHRLVRAVTRPFPGAFSYLDDEPTQKLMVWRAVPFDNQLQWPGSRPGEIVEVFYDGSFVVRTGDGSMLIQESEGPVIGTEDIGRVLGPAGTPRKVWDNLPV